MSQSNQDTRQVPSCCFEVWRCVLFDTESHDTSIQTGNGQCSAFSGVLKASPFVNAILRSQESPYVLDLKQFRRQAVICIVKALHLGVPYALEALTEGCLAPKSNELVGIIVEAIEISRMWLLRGVEELLLQRLTPHVDVYTIKYVWPLAQQFELTHVKRICQRYFESHKELYTPLQERLSELYDETTAQGLYNILLPPHGKKRAQQEE